MSPKLRGRVAILIEYGLQTTAGPPGGGFSVFQIPKTSPGPVSKFNANMADPSDERLAHHGPSDQRLRDAVLWAMTEFSAAAGHEINNPVATIVGYATQLARGETDPHRRETLRTIAAQAYRIRDMIADCMLFARPPEPQPAAVGVAAVVDHVLTSLRDRIPAWLNVETQVPADLCIWADPDGFAVVVSELVLNAINACRLLAGIGSPGETKVDRGPNEPNSRADSRSLRIMISATAEPSHSNSDAANNNAVIDNAVAPNSAGNWIRISVADTGAGLSAADCDQIFNPFYSGRVAGRGLGFGLSKCWRIATQHVAEIAATPATPHGMTFTLRWPADSATAKEAVTAAATRCADGDADRATATLASFARHVR